MKRRLSNISSALPNKSDIGQAADQTAALLFASKILVCFFNNCCLPLRQASLSSPCKVAVRSREVSMVVCNRFFQFSCGQRLSVGAAGNVFVFKLQIQRENPCGMLSRFRLQRGGGVVASKEPRRSFMFTSFCSGTAIISQRYWQFNGRFR